MTNVIQPIIGIICGLDTDNQNYNLGRKYVDAIIEEAGLPILIPVGNDVVTIDSIMKLCDGLMFVGGSDVDPWYFSQEPQFPTKKIDPERDNFEIELIKSALRELKPLLGICRGMQVINIAAGGDIYQDLSGQKKGVFIHEQNAPRWHPTHKIKIHPETKLERILGRNELRVNSFHHQAVRKVAPGFKISALSGDGVIEGIEHDSLEFALGIQWHPEELIKTNTLSKNLFAGLIEASKKGKRN